MAYRRTPAVLEQQAQNRARVLDAAHSLVAEGGWAACAVAEVARRAGVATGSVYAHVADKGELMAEVFRRASSREVAAFAEAGRAAAGPCPCTAVEAAVRTFAARAQRAPRLAYALLAEPVDAAAVDVERLAFRRAYADHLAVLLRDGVARGLLPEQPVDVTAAAVVGAISEVLVVPLARAAPDPEAYARTVDALITHTLRSLGGRHEHDARGLQPGPAAGGPRRR